jgi:hypothetical protein
LILLAGTAIGLAAGLWLTFGEQRGYSPMVLSLAGLVAAVVADTFFPRAKLLRAGARGLDVWGTFVPYASIAEVARTSERLVVGTYDRNPAGDGIAWTVSLDLDDGRTLCLASFTYDAASWQADADPQGTELVHEIEAARALWAARADRAREETLVERGERDARAWLADLRRMGAEPTGNYRRAPLDREALGRLLFDSRARPSTRAAAALVLVAAGDKRARRRLRVATEGLADPRLRIAVARVTRERDEEALAEALDALEEAEQEAWPRRAGGS